MKLLTRLMKRNKMLKKLVATCLIFSLVLPSVAQARGGLIRDAETEELIREYARPIFRVAGVGGQNIQIHLVRNKSFNAFVVDGKNMFIHVGAIINSKTPNQIIGVIAHETGHITGGHLARLRDNMRRAQSASVALQLLGIAAMIGGAFAKGNAGGNIASAGRGLMGGQSVITRHVLAYRRIEEASADQAGMSFLNKTHQSGKGMLQTFEYFADQSLAGMRYADPYLQSHPMPQTRIANLRNLVRRSPYRNKKDSQALQLRHDMVRAKLIGFLDYPSTVMRKFPRSRHDLPAQYARAIASYRQSGLRAFIPRINRLISRLPKNPYFYELKGQFLLEGGLPKDAVGPLRKAVSLAPRADLIRIMLAQALLATNQRRYLKEAIRLLRAALVREKQSATGYRQLALAYGRRNQIGAAELASAQAYFYEGKLSLAKEQARRAKKKFRRGSPAWIKADDIVSYTPPSR